ncbi:hypothetical protein [Natrinema altunense]|uniref:DoxX family protein n=1 Tax=Natrinema altunense (strain JCM 12890 / CGMCC 1.3731 / AJ2) TaxID=1227494 RepID=L9ZXH1_NATA2|nr:hypothetical protein [Natrinema altunense]ELY91205.1 hypothetical protein C485_02349 [Natrinema altunense JCM 12890]
MTSGPVSAETTRPSRDETAPLGIKILCVVTVLLAASTIFFGLVRVIVGLSTISTAGLGSAIVRPAGVATITGLLSLVLSVGQIIVAFGLWALKPWAWAWSLALYGLIGLHWYGQGNLVVTVLLGVMVYIASKKEYYH